MYRISRGHCSSFYTNLWNFDPEYIPMRAKITSYVFKCPCRTQYDKNYFPTTTPFFFFIIIIIMITSISPSPCSCFSTTLAVASPCVRYSSIPGSSRMPIPLAFQSLSSHHQQQLPVVLVPRQRQQQLFPNTDTR